MNHPKDTSITQILLLFIAMLLFALYVSGCGDNTLATPEQLTGGSWQSTLISLNGDFHHKTLVFGADNKAKGRFIDIATDNKTSVVDYSGTWYAAYDRVEILWDSGGSFVCDYVLDTAPNPADSILVLCDVTYTPGPSLD